MDDTRYIISDAAKMVDVESHVLRYWEDELGIEVPRNELGHRYYTDKEIKLFSDIRALKEKGFQLKAIKMILQAVNESMPASNIISIDDVRKNYTEESEKLEAEAAVEIKQDVETAEVHKEELVDKPEILEAKEETTELTKAEETASLTPSEKMSHFKYIMDGIITQALRENNKVLEGNISHGVVRELDNQMKAMEAREEMRYRLLDEAIRGKQKGRKQVAAAKVPAYTPTKMNKKKGWFGRK